MIVATHRVIGLLEWPINSEPTPEMLTFLNHEPLLGDFRTVKFCPFVFRSPTVTRRCVAADVPQLRRDLQRLFQTFTAAE